MRALHDLRYAALPLRSKGFTATVFLTLSVELGANSAPTDAPDVGTGTSAGFVDHLTADRAKTMWLLVISTVNPPRRHLSPGPHQHWIP